MKIWSIAPVLDHNSSRGHTFEVTLKVDEKSWTVNLQAHILLDYAHFRERILEVTGRLYGNQGVYENWNQEVAKHLDAFWDKNKEAVPRNKLEKTAVEQRQSPVNEYGGNGPHSEDFHHQAVS